MQWFDIEGSLDEYTNDGKYETNIWLFETECTIDVKFPHSKDIKTQTIDITKKVKDLVVEFADLFQILLPGGYGLLNKDGLILNRKVSLPEQIRDFSQVTFQRVFQIYSAEDLLTIDTTRLAYKDAKLEFTSKKNIRLFEEEALEIFGCVIVAENLNPAKLQQSVRSFFPEDFEVSHDFIAKFKSFSSLESYHAPPDEFNAMKKYIQLVRRCEGFGAARFDHVKVEYYFDFTEHSLKSYLLATPLSLHIYNKRSNVLEDTIPYSKILSFNMLSDALTIEFAYSVGQTATYVFYHPHPGAIRSFIENYQEIVLGVLAQRARQKEFDGVLNDIPENDRIYLYTTNDLKLNPTDPKVREEYMREKIRERLEKERANNKGKRNRRKKKEEATSDMSESSFFDEEDPFANILIPYDRNWSGETTLNAALQFLLLQQDPDYVAMIKKTDVTQWLKPDDVLVSHSIPDYSTIFILRNNQPISISFSDHRTISIKLDITKTIDELTKDIFAYLGCPGTHGYTFCFQQILLHLLIIFFQFQINVLIFVN